MKRFIPLFVVGSTAICWSQTAQADCRAPDILTAEIRRAGSAVAPEGGGYDVVLIVGVEWRSDGGPEGGPGSPVAGCDEGEAWELEVIIQTDPQRCFAQPVGGFDSYERPPGATSTLPLWYADIWNYAWPPDAAGDIVGQECGILFPDFFQATGDFWDAKLGVGDDIANFAIGTKDSTELETDFSYEFTYPLELPDSEECTAPSNLKTAGEAYVRVNMHEIPNECTLYHVQALESLLSAPPFVGADFSTDCAHLLGFGGCAEMFGTKILDYFDIGQHETLAARICGPTEEVVFDWPFTPASHNVALPGGPCEDLDGDGLYGIKQPLHLWGTLARDCNDNPVYGQSVEDEAYDPATRSCGVSYPCDGEEECSWGFCGEGLCNTTCGQCYDTDFSEETECSDLLDNDYDLLADCADPDCAGGMECCPDPGFVDVAEGEWFYHYVRRLVCVGAIEGGGALFNPNEGATRAEYLKIHLVLAFPGVDFPNVEYFSTFPDVPEFAWYAPYIGWAADHGIVEGYIDSTFKPEQVVLRNEAANIAVKIGRAVGAHARYHDLHQALLQMKGLGQVDEEDEYPDVRWDDLSCEDEQHPEPEFAYLDDCWYYHPVYTLKAYDGAACGKEIGKEVLFDRFAPVTRAETAKIACIVSGVCDAEECQY